ncbi:MAG TPA: hypothetical protein VL485_24010 [Ktedonobacteraceae bacterium]|nr:hypothetical protein [Ktedonobacteraceae bacterium]
MISTNSIRFGGYAFARTVYFLFMTRLGRGILGGILLLAGICYGLGSHMVSYHAGPTGQAEVFVDGNGDDYVRFPGNTAVYIIKAVDFDPYPNPALVANLHSVSKLVYKEGALQINSTQDDGTVLHVSGYNVSQFSFQDASGTDQGTYTTTEYRQHPGNYYANQWPTASILLGLGAFLLLLATLIPYWVDKIVWREKPTKTFQA